MSELSERTLLNAALKQVDRTQAELDALKKKHTAELKEINDRNRHPSFGWIFHFVDIIYVATIYSIGQLFEQCGVNYKVFFIAASYFAIMFSTRTHFDQYAFTFKINEKNDILRVILFIFYCLAVYNMTLNIAFDNTGETSNSVNHYGSCQRNIEYDNGFAYAFIGSRALIMGLYLKHYILPDSELVPFLKLLHPGEEVLTLLQRNTAKNEYLNQYWGLLMRKTIPLLCSISAMSIIFAEVSPLIAFGCVAVIEALGDFFGEVLWKPVITPREVIPDPGPGVVSVVKPKVGTRRRLDLLMPDVGHFQERLGLFFMLILGESMVGLLFVPYNEDRPQRTYGTVISAFFLVAAVGMQFFERAQSDPHSEKNYTRHGAPVVIGSGHYGSAHTTTATAASASEREARVSTASVNSQLGLSIDEGHHSTQSESSIASVKPAVGASNPLDVDAAHTHDSDHPLLHKRKRAYGLYVWSHCVIAFFMLVAATSIVDIYYNVAEVTTDELPERRYRRILNSSGTEQHYNYQLQKAKATGGLIGMWVTMMFMEFLQPEYRRQLLKSTSPPATLTAQPTQSLSERKKKLLWAEHYNQLYAKFLFAVKAFAIFMHLLYYFKSDSSASKGNYFVGYNAIIASMPSICDVVKLVYDRRDAVQAVRAEIRSRISFNRNSSGSSNGGIGSGGNSSGIGGGGNRDSQVLMSEPKNSRGSNSSSNLHASADLEHGSHNNHNSTSSNPMLN